MPKQRTKTPAETTPLRQRFCCFPISGTAMPNCRAVAREAVERHQKEEECRQKEEERRLKEAALAELEKLKRQLDRM